MTKGYQPNKGNLNPNDPPRGGCGIPHHSIKGDKKMAAMGNITMEVGHFYVKTFELQARIEACKARIEGMKAENADCENDGCNLRFIEKDFVKYANELNGYADELKKLWEILNGKEGDQ